MNERLKALHDAGVSIWLDDLSRELVRRGELQRLIDEDSVTGVTTNPTIFASALAKGEAYTEQLAELKSKGADVEDAIRSITTDDVREACAMFEPVYRASNGYDGRVSIEVDPRLAQENEKTAEQAELLHQMVGAENVLIKIPATLAGLPAITATIARGISVNVTLIFSVERYQAVIDAYMSGLEQAAKNGHDLSKIHSVASFFVSRVDTEIDKRLDAIGGDTARQLKGKAGLANARLAFELFQESLTSDRWTKLAEQGANVQRPLWASTGTKDPSLPDTLYVHDLVTKGVVNTMPGKTLEAFGDHGEVAGDTVKPNIEAARTTFRDLEALGVDLDDVFATLETEGVDKFVVSWGELMETVKKELAKA